MTCLTGCVGLHVSMRPFMKGSFSHVTAYVLAYSKAAWKEVNKKQRQAVLWRLTCVIVLENDERVL